MAAPPRSLWLASCVLINLVSALRWTDGADRKNIAEQPGAARTRRRWDDTVASEAASGTGRPILGIPVELGAAVGAGVSVSTAIGVGAWQLMAHKRRQHRMAALNLTLEEKALLDTEAKMKRILRIKNSTHHHNHKRYRPLNLTEWVEQRYSQELQTFTLSRRMRLRTFYYLCYRPYAAEKQVRKYLWHGNWVSTRIIYPLIPNRVRRWYGREWRWARTSGKFLRRNVLYPPFRLMYKTAAACVPRFNRAGGDTGRGSGILASLTDDQRAKIVELRQELVDEGWARRAERVAFPLSDRLLLRYFRCAHWKEFFPDGNTVKISVTNTIEWREKNKIHELTNDRTRPKYTSCVGLMYQSGMDTQGHPIVYLKPSFLDEHPEALDACSSYQLYTMERTELFLRRSGSEALGFVGVLDCANATFDTLKKFAKSQVSQFTVLATHYPGRLDRAYILHASALVKLAWSFVSPFLTPATRKSIQFAPMDDTEGFLRRELGAAGLQKQHGGRREDFDGSVYLAHEC